ncbi:MAG: histidine phosphatase family protein [Bacilli bacterium]
MNETVIYFVRHSETFPKGNIYTIKNSDSPLVSSEKAFLSINGEKKAEALSKIEELQGIDAIYSSSYDRCMQTAKYFAAQNDTIIHVDERFNERIIGYLDDLSKLSYERIQAKNFDYKARAGESLNEVKKRMADATKQVLMNESGNRVVIVTHSTALVTLLSLWCDIGYNYDDEIILSYNDETIIDGTFTAPMVFKVVFDGMSVLNVEHINID